MSEQLINRSPDLKALKDEGYEVEVVDGHLVVHSVPYVSARCQIKLGKLVSVLDLAGDVTIPPKTHVIMFSGEYPCHHDGRPITGLKHGSSRQVIVDGLTVDHSFSSKPPGSNGYPDYYEKVTTYVAMLENEAQVIDPNVTARTRRVIETKGENEIFRYQDTASARAGVSGLAAKFENLKIGIIGLGGTGSYILDLVAKTPVLEIHLFDRDEFLQHNAFRSPGAPTAEELKPLPNKAVYWAKKYDAMRRGVVAHEVEVGPKNLDLLDQLDFVFLSLDSGQAKIAIIERLERNETSFIDVGMGIGLEECGLAGILRVTTSTPDMRDHVHEGKRINFSERQDDEYDTNIQIADLNALNAALAVIRWKKLIGFYSDLENEHFATYTLDGNVVINENKS